MASAGASSVSSCLGGCHAGPRHTREDKRVIRPRSARRKPGPNLGQGWVGSDAVVRLRRPAGESATHAHVWLDVFGRARTSCVGSLGDAHLQRPDANGQRTSESIHFLEGLGKT
jgi:hypothetical protein